MKVGYFCLGAAALYLATACGGADKKNGFVNRGLNDQSAWLMNEVKRAPTPASRAKGEDAHNYQAQFSVRVAARTQTGDMYNAEERTELPDLILYVRINEQETRIGDASNALQLFAEYPLRLRRGDSVSVRLVDRKNKYFRVRYGARNSNDWSTERTREVPLAQFSFTFEGPGRYFMHQGFGMFFIDFRQLR